MAGSGEQVRLSILPRPASVASQDVAKAPASETETIWIGERCLRVADRLADLPSMGSISIAIDEVITTPPTVDSDESYALERTAEGWSLTAPSTFGALHGVTTLAQLYRFDEAGRVHTISDQPRFPWRGVLIDVARHFISSAMLKRVVDGLAELKMNVLHLHLTDDQAFRFECRAFPQLASEEHLSQIALADLVAYAADRGVRVIPEIDVPGHVTAWLLGVPELGFQQVEATDRFGVHKACLDPTRESTYELLEALFAELVEVFPDEYVHIGGDEVHPAWWSEDPAVTEFMQAQGLQDVRGVQNHFTQRVVSMLNELGKRAIGWDEVLHPNMPNLVVQNWRGATTRDRAAAQGASVIVSAPYYLDLFYPLDMHYAYDPSAPQTEWLKLEDQQQEDQRLAHVAEGIEWTKQWREDAITYTDQAEVLGGEACLWSELVDEKTLPTRLWSRLPAVAERLWSQGPVDDLYVRVEQLLSQAPFETPQCQQKDLVRLGLSEDQVQVAMWLEPVKWYGRLLGQTALEARIAGSEMPQARPYQVDTPLNRVVDFIAPESFSARQLGRDVSWQTFVSLVDRQKTQLWPEDVRPAIEGLQDFARALDSGQLDEATALEMYVPYGEYMLAPIYSWLKHDGH